MTSVIKSFDIRMVSLKPKVVRTDAIQSFIAQETPMVTVRDKDGNEGTGYSYTIGTGGAAVMSLIETVLAPALIGEDADCIEHCWFKMLFSTHATAVGAITSLAMAAIDTALWDLKCKRAGLPLYKAAGGCKKKVPLYTTEGGWLHLSTDEIIDDALRAKSEGFQGSKIKIGSPSVSHDVKRLTALRQAVGDDYAIMTDANQSFNYSRAKQFVSALADSGIEWIEEPMPADDVASHAKLTQQSPVPVAVGESMYSLSQFKDYLHYAGCDIVQADVARIGGITPWLKVAHMAEAYNISICPHFLMELHVSLTCAVSNAPWLEYIPQLDDITLQGMQVCDGMGIPSESPGIGIDWDWGNIAKMQLHKTITIQ